MGRGIRGAGTPRSVTLKVAPVQASLRCRTVERSKEARRERGYDRSARDGRGFEKERERKREKGGERERDSFILSYTRPREYQPHLAGCSLSRTDASPICQVVRDTWACAHNNIAWQPAR